MVESLQRGLQGHVSSAPGERQRAPGGHPLVPRAWVSWQGWERAPFATPAPHRAPFPLERRGLSVPHGLGTFLAYFPGTRLSLCHADTTSRFIGSCS